MNKLHRVYLLPLVWLIIVTLACYGPSAIFGNPAADDDRATAVAEATKGIDYSDSRWKAFATRTVLAEQSRALASPVPGWEKDVPLPTITLQNLPEIWLDYTGSDRPMYRSSLLGAILVDTTGPVPWTAFMSTHVLDDSQRLGRLSPGTVDQRTIFEGTYDPRVDWLSGKLTHYVIIQEEGTSEYLASTYKYILTCKMFAQKASDSDTLQGECNGQITEEMRVPSESSYNYDKTYAVTLTVSGPLSDSLKR